MATCGRHVPLDLCVTACRKSAPDPAAPHQKSMRDVDTGAGAQSVPMRAGLSRLGSILAMPVPMSYRFCDFWSCEKNFEAFPDQVKYIYMC